MNINDLKKWLKQKRAVIVCLQARGSKEEQDRLELGHYMVAIGYDSDNMYFEDPYQSKGYRGCIPIEDFLKRWKDSTSEGAKRFRWGLAVWKDGKVYPDKINKVKEV
jgi:uncharacterized protein YvpB